MGVGQVIADTFGIVKSRFGSLLGLWAIFFGITIVLFIVFGIGMGAVGLAGFATMSEGNMLAAGGGMMVLVVLFYVGYLLLALAQYASLILMASPLERRTVGEALGAGWRAAPALLLLMVVLIFGYIAVAMVFGVAGAALSMLGDAGTLVAVVLLLPALIWLGCRLSLLFAVVAVDGVRNPFTAIGRSWQLTRGHALTIFLASMVFLVIVVVLFGVALLPSIGLLRSMADPGAMIDPASAGPAVGGIMLMMLGLLVVSVLFNLAYCAFMAVLHATLAGARGEQAAEVFG